MATATSVSKISRDELKAKIDRGDKFLLLEILDATEYREGHLPHALNLPPDRIEELAPELIRDKNMEVVTYCARYT